MNRRHFIRLSSSTLTGLLFTDFTSFSGTGALRPALPARLWVTLDSGRHELQSAGANKWIFQDVIAEMDYAGDALRVRIQSPGTALLEITAQWPLASAEPDTVLGDHWERTYGDVSFQPPVFDRRLPWYFIGTSAQQATCFGVRTGCSTLCYWQLGAGSMQLTMDTRSAGMGVVLGNRVLHCADIITTRTQGQENVFATARRFCGLMSSSPRLPKEPVYGINDWYFAYGRNSTELILKHTSLLAELATDTHNRPFSVVDAGWAKYSPLQPDDCCWGDDFSRPNAHFQDMGKLAGDIRGLGMRPGLWTRPLSAAHDDPKSLLLPSIPGRDDPKSPVLDPTIEENLARIQRNIHVYRQWGYEMVKHDYSTYDITGKWGFQMTGEITQPGWQFHDRSKTTAEVVLQLYQKIREAAGDIYLIGCNTISHLSAGIFELNRTGDDTSGKEWERTRKMGVNTLGFRLVQHQHFYSCDGDCVGLTRDVPWERNKQWMQLLSQSSAPLFISAQPEALGSEQRVFIKDCFSRAARPMPVAEPLDWLTNPWPREWLLGGIRQSFDWG